MSDGELVQAFQIMLETSLSEINTMQPGSIVSYDAQRNRAVVKATLPKTLANGNSLEAPNVIEVPVVWPMTCGGTCGLTLPMRAGDGVKIEHAQRSLDGWLSGQTAAPDDPRRFDLSDAVATPGLAPKDVSANPTDLELRFGAAKLRLTPGGTAIFETAGGNLTITQDGVATFTGPKVRVNGDVEVTGDVRAGTVSLKTHRHANSGGNGVGGIPLP